MRLDVERHKTVNQRKKCPSTTAKKVCLSTSLLLAAKTSKSRVLFSLCKINRVEGSFALCIDQLRANQGANESIAKIKLSFSIR